MRTIKDPVVRKAEILDAAEKLFNEKGYAKATTEDIMEATGIAKGTLYYHFKNKEDILLAMIDRQIEQREVSMRRIADDKSFSAAQKLVKVIQLLSHSGMMADGLYENGNSELHQKSFNRSLMRFTPIMTEIVEEGIKAGEFSTPYPQECVELLFCASELHDPRAFSWSKEVRKRKEEAFFWMLEKTLGISDSAKEKVNRLIEKPWAVSEK
ncbi:MAG: TetR/AcrR family transcriptional regulator [Clostridiales bacterium]|nr:TetR/AcrR family transcriptional regulator [Clostridiales bacterium]